MPRWFSCLPDLSSINLVDRTQRVDQYTKSLAVFKS